LFSSVIDCDFQPPQTTSKQQIWLFLFVLEKEKTLNALRIKGFQWLRI